MQKRELKLKSETSYGEQNAWYESVNCNKSSSICSESKGALLQERELK